MHGPGRGKNCDVALYNNLQKTVEHLGCGVGCGVTESWTRACALYSVNFALS